MLVYAHLQRTSKLSAHLQALPVHCRCTAGALQRNSEQFRAPPGAPRDPAHLAIRRTARTSPTPQPPNPPVHVHVHAHVRPRLRVRAHVHVDMDMDMDMEMDMSMDMDMEMEVEMEMGVQNASRGGSCRLARRAEVGGCRLEVGSLEVGSWKL